MVKVGLAYIQSKSTSDSNIVVAPKSNTQENTWSSNAETLCLFV